MRILIKWLHYRFSDPDRYLDTLCITTAILTIYIVGYIGVALLRMQFGMS